MNLTCYVVDDELYAAEQIGELINKTPGLELIGMETEDEIALRKLLNNDIKADIVFLDIELKKINGVDFALKIKDFTHVIFVTGAERYAVAAFEHGITDYLLKPVLYKRFLKSVERVKTEIERSAKEKEVLKSGIITIRCNRKMIFLKPEEIVYIESASNYLKFYMIDEKMHITYMSFTTLDEVLNYPDLMRIHKSFMVNLNFIKSLDGNMLEMNNGLTIQMGASFREGFLKRFNV